MNKKQGRKQFERSNLFHIYELLWFIDPLLMFSWTFDLLIFINGGEIHTFILLKQDNFALVMIKPSSLWPFKLICGWSREKQTDLRTLWSSKRHLRWLWHAGLTGSQNSWDGLRNSLSAQKVWLDRSDHFMACKFWNHFSWFIWPCKIITDI